MPAHPFMPMSERYLKKLLDAPWETEERDAGEVLDHEDNLKPFEAVKRTLPLLKDNTSHPTCE